MFIKTKDTKKCKIEIIELDDVNLMLMIIR